MNVTFFKTADADLARKLIRHLDATSESPISFDADGPVTILKCQPTQLYRLKAFAEGFAAGFGANKPQELQAALPEPIRREMECMVAIHGASDGEMDSDAQ